MRFVDRGMWPPHTCAITQRSAEDTGRLLDTEMTLPVIDPRVYISDLGMEQLAAEFDYVPRKQLDDAEAEIQELELRLEQAEADAHEADKKVQAIDVLASAGFTARKRPGRPPRKVAA